MSYSLPISAQVPQTPELPARFTQHVRRHPCLDDQAHLSAGRLHLPVSPACNIRCRFCRRAIDARLKMPGVATRLLGPEEAVGIVGRALALCPQLRVVGIAGPGEALATDHAVDALSRVHWAYPDLLMCLSTNGLMLHRRIDSLVKAGVTTVSVTVNAVDAAIQQQICGGILWEGRWISGHDAAEILLAQQLSGISAAARQGLYVKVNAVLIPGVNDLHLGKVARAVKDSGAQRMNIIPLIATGTPPDWRAPSREEIDQARSAAEQLLPVQRTCRQCRADACGIPGAKTDYSAELLGAAADTTFSHG